MITQPKSVKFEINPGQEVFIETGKLARQADGAVTVRQGNCILLATVVANKDPKDGQDFFPLSVDYQEKFASAGRIPGSFFKREARLNDYEILTSRLIDRALRPLFPEDYFALIINLFAVNFFLNSTYMLFIFMIKFNLIVIVLLRVNQSFFDAYLVYFVKLFKILILTLSLILAEIDG